MAVFSVVPVAASDRLSFYRKVRLGSAGRFFLLDTRVVDVSAPGRHVDVQHQLATAPVVVVKTDSKEDFHIWYQQLAGRGGWGHAQLGAQVQVLFLVPETYGDWLGD